MRALTVRQPWATLLVWTPPGRGAPFKRHEVRSWPPPRSLHGGDVAIHAAKRAPPFVDFQEARKCVPCAHLGLESPLAWNSWRYDRLPCGAVIGIGRGLWAAQVVEVDGARALCRHAADNSAVELAVHGRGGDWSPGVWLWTFQRVEALAEPVPAKGRQGLWEWECP